jgi:Holliday junction resolvase RusA-like endonuclease
MGSLPGLQCSIIDGHTSGNDRPMECQKESLRCMKEQSITFAVKGQPKPKDRPRFSGHAYTTKKTREYEQHVRVSAMAALTKWRHDNNGKHWNAAGPFGITVFFFMGDKRKRDLDNCLKSISDALEKLLFNNDCQLDEICAMRDLDIRSPRAVVTVRRLREGE